MSYLRTAAAAAFMMVLLSSVPARTPASPADPSDLFKQLPVGDLIATIDVPLMLDRVIPAVLSGKPESQKRFESNLARARNDFGIDVRQIRRIAISGAPMDVDSQQWVAVLDGEFESLAQAGALGKRVAAYVAQNPRYSSREESHEGVSVFVLTEAATSGRSSERYAAAVLDAKTVFIGSTSGVMRAVDVHKGKAPAASSNTTLVEAWSQTDASAPTRFGFVLSAAMLKAEIERDPGNPFLKTLQGIRYIFGTAGLQNGGDVVVRSIARNNTAEDAKATLAAVQTLLALGSGAQGTAGQLVGLTTASSTGTDVTVQMIAPPDKQDALFKLLAP